MRRETVKFPDARFNADLSRSRARKKIARALAHTWHVVGLAHGETKRFELHKFLECAADLLQQPETVNGCDLFWSVESSAAAAAASDAHTQRPKKNSLR